MIRSVMNLLHRRIVIAMGNMQKLRDEIGDEYSTDSGVMLFSWLCGCAMKQAWAVRIPCEQFELLKRDMRATARRHAHLLDLAEIDTAIEQMERNGGSELEVDWSLAGHEEAV